MDEGAENSLLVGVFGGGEFGMPLEGDRPGMCHVFDGFDEPIGGVGGNLPVGRNRGHCLVMPGNNFDFALIHDGGKDAARFQDDGVAGGGGGGVGLQLLDMVHRITKGFGDMGNQHGTAGDAEHLHTPTNAQDGEICLNCQSCQVEFKAIALLIHLGNGGMGLAVIAFGVNVAAARKHNAIQVGNQAIASGLPRSQQNGHTTRPPHCRNVGLVQLVMPRFRSSSGGNADDRSQHGHRVEGVRKAANSRHLQGGRSGATGKDPSFGADATQATIPGGMGQLRQACQFKHNAHGRNARPERITQHSVVITTTIAQAIAPHVAGDRRNQNQVHILRRNGGRLRVRFGNPKAAHLQGIAAAGRPHMPDHCLAVAAGKCPLLGQMEQGCQIGFLPRTEKRQHRPGFLEGLPLLQMAAEAIALFSPQIRVHSLACPEERSPQFTFLSLDIG